jgi:hypothetical protein
LSDFRLTMGIGARRPLNLEDLMRLHAYHSCAKLSIRWLSIFLHQPRLPISNRQLKRVGERSEIPSAKLVVSELIRLPPNLIAIGLVRNKVCSRRNEA